MLHRQRILADAVRLAAVKSNQLNLIPPKPIYEDQIISIHRHFGVNRRLGWPPAAVQKSAQQVQPPPPVTVAPVEQKEIVEWSEFTGRTEPVESVEIRPRVSGYIQEVRFQSGQLVKKGDVLFVIDPRWNQASV